MIYEDKISTSFFNFYDDEEEAGLPGDEDVEGLGGDEESGTEEEESSE